MTKLTSARTIVFQSLRKPDREQAACTHSLRHSSRGTAAAMPRPSHARSWKSSRWSRHWRRAFVLSERHPHDDVGSSFGLPRRILRKGVRQEVDRDLRELGFDAGGDEVHGSENRASIGAFLRDDGQLGGPLALAARVHPPTRVRPSWRPQGWEGMGRAAMSLTSGCPCWRWRARWRFR